MCLHRCGVYCVWLCTTWVTCLAFCNLVSDTSFHSEMPQKLVGDLDVRRILSWKHCNCKPLLWWPLLFPTFSCCTLSCWCAFPSFRCEHKGLFSHSEFHRNSTYRHWLHVTHDCWCNFVKHHMELYNFPILILVNEVHCCHFRGPP